MDGAKGVRKHVLVRRKKALDGAESHVLFVRGFQADFSRSSPPSLSAAHAGTHSTGYSALGLNLSS